MPEVPFGPRASIMGVGVCEELPNGDWYVTGWVFHGRNDPRIIDRGCPFVHDEQNTHIGYLGWLWSDLKALSDAQIELSMLEAEDRRPL